MKLTLGEMALIIGIMNDPELRKVVLQKAGITEEELAEKAKAAILNLELERLRRLRE